MCSKMFEMFVLTLVINISLENSVRMSPSDGISTLSGMPFITITCLSALSGVQILALWVLYCCHDHFGNILWFTTQQLRNVTVHQKLHIFDVIYILGMMVIFTSHQLYKCLHSGLQCSLMLSSLLTIC